VVEYQLWHAMSARLGDRAPLPGWLTTMLRRVLEGRCGSLVDSQRYQEAFPKGPPRFVRGLIARLELSETDGIFRRDPEPLEELGVVGLPEVRAMEEGRGSPGQPRRHQGSLWGPLLARLRRGLLWVTGGPAAGVRAVVAGVCLVRLLAWLETRLGFTGGLAALLHQARRARFAVIAIAYVAAAAGSAMGGPGQKRAG